MSNRQLHEVGLSGPVSDWLRARGYVVYAEVPDGGGAIDLVGHIAGDTAHPDRPRLVAVELKMCLSRRLLYQAARALLACDEVYVAVASQPRSASLVRCGRFGIGVLVVRDGTVRKLRPAMGGGGKSPHRQQRIIDRLNRRDPGGVAGMPVLKGVRPRHDVARRVADYVRHHPDATWSEIFEKVRNHYAHTRSMRSAMRLFADAIGEVAG